MSPYWLAGGLGVLALVLVLLSERLQGLEDAVLDVLQRHDTGAGLYGQDIVRLSGGRVPYWAVYRVLSDLQDAGLVVSVLDEADLNRVTSQLPRPRYRRWP